MSGITATQAWITGIETVELRDARLEPDATSVLIRTAYAGICGSDLHTYRHGHAWLGFPVGPGHEAVGTIEAVGADVESLVPGDRVVLQFAVFCGECRMCRAGRENMCERLVAYGAHEPGGMAHAFLVPATAARKLPADLDFKTACLIEPTACVLHAIARAGDVAGATVAVLGGGTIGLCLTAALRDAGAARIVVTDRREFKLDVARRVGADESVMGGAPETLPSIRDALGAAPDVVFDCAATAVTVEQSMKLADRGGSILIVGCRGPVGAVDWNRVQDLEQSLIGTQMFTDADFKAAMSLVDRNGTRLEQLVTAVYPVEQAAEAFAAAASGSEIKVQVAGGV
jgi:2-desacetyl-2-hydroxyethyl bacteriochlorophyllide A dehydrogenase